MSKEAAATTEVKPAKVKKTAKFDSPRIVASAEKPITVENLATASGYELDGSFKRRTKGLIRSGRLVERTAGKVQAVKEKPAA